MGHKTSTLKVYAEATLGAGVPSVDALTLSSSASSCWGRGRRRLARFTYPRRGWECIQGMQVCWGRELQHLPLVELRHEDPSTAVRVKCSCRGAPVYAAAMPLACLLDLLEEAVAGDTAVLRFTLAGGEDRVARLTFTCPGAAMPWACHGWLWSHSGSEWECLGQGDAACLSPREGGCGAPASPGQQELGQSQEPHGPALEDKADEASASAFLAVPQTGMMSLPASDHEFTVPGEHCSDPSASAQDGAVPEVDLSESSIQALYRALYHTGPEPHEGVPPGSAQNTSVSGACCGDPPPSAEARVAVPEVDLGESSSLALYSNLHNTEPDVGVPPPSAQNLTVPSVHCGDLSASAQDSAVPDIDLGESSSLALFYALHQPEPAPDEGNPPASAEAAGAVPDEESLEPVPGAQEAPPPELGRPWKCWTSSCTAS